jgi:hypothetical protein
MKKSLGWICLFSGLAGLLFILIGIFIGLTSIKTIQHSQQILADFQKAAAFVDSFKDSKHRLPTQKELDGFFGGYKIDLNLELAGEQDKPEFVTAKPVGSYVLSYWRGEWNEYYAGWNKQTTLVFDRNLYFPFHSIALAILALIFPAALFYVGIRLMTYGSV